MIRPRLGALLFAMSACAMPGPALGQISGSGPIYNTNYYAAAQGQELVGVYYGDCFYTGPVYHSLLEGQTSAYSEDFYAGYCREGVWEHI
jgi:hypothetical protein